MRNPGVETGSRPILHRSRKSVASTTAEQSVERDAKARPAPAPAQAERPWTSGFHLPRSGSQSHLRIRHVAEGPQKEYP
jgi:hypothetical protein